VSSGKLTVARDFEISSSTKVSMAPGDDPEGYGMALENELLAAGFDVAPYELAKSVVRSESTTRYRASGRSGHSASGTEVFARTYLPTAIAVSLRYTVRRYAMKTDCISAYIRVIDLSDERLLASYRAEGSEWAPVHMSSVIADFVGQLEALSR
jgi:hypothetical protein